jgi:hypothetical protein
MMYILRNQIFFFEMGSNCQGRWRTGSWSSQRKNSGEDTQLSLNRADFFKQKLDFEKIITQFQSNSIFPKETDHRVKGTVLWGLRHFYV